MTNRIKSMLCALLLCVAAPAFAAGNYTIEVVIFAQNSYGAGALPYNASAPNAQPPATSGARYISSYNGSPYSQLEAMPSSSFVLSDDAARLKREGYQILWHGGWFQNVSTGRNPEIRINTGDGRVDGTIRVDRSRYLHFKPNLLLTRNGAQYQLKQSRRMRSRELHYLDHPLFGVLVYARPI
ncbi:CsiV family protein [Marinobacterium mangrovicola]|uniref:Peptidoglycan-binding protein CsiV n=1 Tax=Marinobacterium mangrovicola TaxID=1476959 RepID=A0A4V2PEF0_9GAMM|nr:CsiV family protein [Marinobacterium mangrovicola]TCK08876.1 peptidoglycan-binding protein CsiV [Marinobacterium mangrovicola]